MKLFHTHKEGYIYILKARRTYILKYVCKMYVCVCVCVCVLYIYNHSPCFQDAQNLEKRTQATVIVSNLTLCLCSCCLPIHPGAWIIFLKSIWLRLLCLNGFPTVAWKISWMEEPGRLQFMGSLRVGHNWVTSLSLFTFMHWNEGEGKSVVVIEISLSQYVSFLCFLIYTLWDKSD